MKQGYKVLVNFFVALFLFINISTVKAAVIDSYSSTNQDDDYQLYTGATFGSVGQSFTVSDNYTLTSVDLYLAKLNSPTGNLTAKIYAHDGTYGSSGVPTGSILATSDSVDISTLSSDPTHTSTEFTFSGANQISLTASTYYFIVVTWAGDGNGSNKVYIGRDSSSPTHGGNSAYYIASWAPGASSDIIFTVNGDIEEAPPAEEGTATTTYWNTEITLSYYYVMIATGLFAAFIWLLWIKIKV